MRKQLLILGMMWMIVLSVSASSGKQLFNEGWRFWLGDTLIAKNETFDDSSWKKLVLPHDWSIEQNSTKRLRQETTAAICLPEPAGTEKRSMYLKKPMERNCNSILKGCT